MSKWEMVRLGDVCAGKVASLKTNSDCEIEYIDIASIDNLKKQVVSSRKINAKDAPSRAKQLLKEKDVLVSTVRPNLNAVAIIKTNSDKMLVGSTGYSVLRCTDKILAEFLFLYCQSKGFIRNLTKVAKGASYPAVSDNDVKSLQIPLPPMEVQQKIAQTLDAAAALLALRKEQLAALDKLIKAVFYEMFGDPVTNEKKWEIKTLAQLSAKAKNSLKRGPFGGSLKKEIFVNDGYLVYEQFHALNNDYSFRRYFIDEETFEQLKDFEVKPGDVLISCSGVYLGKLSVVPKDALPGVINQALLKVTLNDNEMNQQFFVSVFSDPSFKNKHIISNRGSGIPNLPPMTVMKKIGFITPPLVLQTQFAEIVTKIEEQKALVQKAIDESQYLFDSLMNEYFN